MATAEVETAEAVLGAATAALFDRRLHFNVFSLDPCPGGPGSGSIGGLCVTTLGNLLFILNQVAQPLGTPLFHFEAASSYVSWGPLPAPPLAVQAICFDFTGGVLGPISPVAAITIL